MKFNVKKKNNEKEVTSRSKMLKYFKTAVVHVVLRGEMLKQTGFVIELLCNLFSGCVPMTVPDYRKAIYVSAHFVTEK